MTLKPLSEIPVLAGSDEKGAVQRDNITHFEQSKQCKIACGVKDVFSRRPTYITVSSASTGVIDLAKHQRLATTSTSLLNIFHFKMTSNLCIYHRET